MATTIVKKTDSMTTIQSKLDKGGTIKFTTGTYKITKQLKISKNSVIDLNGSTLQRKASIQSIFLNKVTGSTKGYNGDGNISIINGTFEGMGGYSYDNLLTFFHSHDITIYNCKFQDILCHGIEINSCKDVRIYGCKFLGFNMKDADSSYLENIQLDYASYIGFVLAGTSRTSKCYDGTGCNNIEIYDNLFSKSNYRDYPYTCIGEHTQLSGIKYRHTNIKIHHNEFHCKINPELKQPCLSIIGMENVKVYENSFECSRVARIYSKTYSYTNAGLKVSPKSGDGICKNVTISCNTIKGCTTNKEAFHQYNKSGEMTHTEIIKTPNTFMKL